MTEVRKLILEMKARAERVVSGGSVWDKAALNDIRTPANILSICQYVEAQDALLRECAEQFRFYEKNHRAKGTPDADAKAEVNAAVAARIETALAQKGEEGRS